LKECQQRPRAFVFQHGIAVGKGMKDHRHLHPFLHSFTFDFLQQFHHWLLHDPMMVNAFVHQVLAIVDDVHIILEAFQTFFLIAISLIFLQDPKFATLHLNENSVY
jgi:hypothetical protein